MNSNVAHDPVPKDKIVSRPQTLGFGCGRKPEQSILVEGPPGRLRNRIHRTSKVLNLTTHV